MTPQNYKKILICANLFINFVKLCVKTCIYAIFVVLLQHEKESFRSSYHMARHHGGADLDSDGGLDAP